MPKPPASKARRVLVDFGADQNYLISGITKDVTTLECIYDLIDNSIDAARNDLLGKKGPRLDHYGLPASYSGYEVRVNISLTSFNISDNCSGIAEAAVAKRSFMTGARSSHPFGIGTFGVGLNRAVFKLGSKTDLVTDDARTYLTLSFRVDQVRDNEGKGIYAESSKSKGKKMYRLEITELNGGIVQDFKSARWQESMKRGVRERYGRFIKKGLKLFVDGSEVKPFEKGIQQNLYFPPLFERRELADGVMFYLEAGFHEDYDLSPGAGAGGKNKNLAEEYGWYVVCNDRIILVADRSKITGWKQWHPEYNGFVGWVHYVSKDPDSLPWDSKKTGIDTHSGAYVNTLFMLSEATKKFRTANRKRLKKNKAKKNGGTDGGGESAGNGYGGSENPGDVGPTDSGHDSGGESHAAESGGNSGNDGRKHTSDLKSVFVRCDVKSNRPKIAALVIEASETPIDRYPYRAALMLRTLVEHALRDYIARHGHFAQVKAYSITKAEQALGRTLNDQEKKGRRVDFDEVLAWTIENPEIWPDGSDKAVCKRSLVKYQRFLKKLNGVVHEVGDIIDEPKITEIRNEVMTALVIMLEH